MASDDRISLLVREAQKRIFRLAERDHGLSFKALSLDSGIPYNSIRGYASGETIMAIPALLKLVGVIPDELLSQLLDPVGRHIAENGSDEPDYDAIGDAAGELEAEVRRSRHPASPGGTNIVPIEKQAIRAKHHRLTGRAA